MFGHKTNYWINYNFDLMMATDVMFTIHAEGDVITANVMAVHSIVMDIFDPKKST